MNNQDPEIPSGIPKTKHQLGLHLTMLALSLGLLGVLIHEINQDPKLNVGGQINATFKQINANDYNANHPEPMTLTQANVVKTFTPSPFMHDATDDQDNVNQQIDLYLKSITNVNDYRVQTTTTPGSWTKDYSATLTLTRK